MIKYYVGREVEVYYKPNKPKIATLETGSDSLLLTLGYIAVLGVIAYLIWIYWAQPVSPIGPLFF